MISALPIALDDWGYPIIDPTPIPPHLEKHQARSCSVPGARTPLGRDAIGVNWSRLKLEQGQQRVRPPAQMSIDTRKPWSREHSPVGQDRQRLVAALRQAGCPVDGASPPIANAAVA